jgi:hypothetical protein
MTPMPRKPPARSCKGQNKHGKPCKAAPLTDNDYCSAHDPTLPEETRFGSSTQAREASLLKPSTRFPRLHEVVERRLEERADDVIGTALKALSATSMLVDKDGNEHVHEDARTRLAAAVALMERGMGKPAQTTNVNADVRAAVLTVAANTPEQRHAIAEVLRARPGVSSTQPPLTQPPDAA